MTFSRYNDRNTLNKIDERKQVKIKERQATINFYETNSKKINKNYENFSFFDYTWKNGDKLYKIAQTFYGDPMLWWVIAEVNKQPTDFHYSPGDIIKVPNPTSLEEVIKYLGY